MYIQQGVDSMGLPNGKSERDLLIELCVDMKWVKQTVSDHVKEHVSTRLVVIGSLFSVAIAVGGIIIAFLK
jgi:hypothetical protein